MFWKISASLCIIVIAVRCEPPSTNYGVPFNNNNNNFGSNSYGPPPPPASINNNFGGNSGYGQDYNNHGDSGSYDHSHHEGADHDHSEPKSYEFGYAVKDDYTGNDYKRREQSDGNQVQGEYRVQLPDGRTQIVTYYADWKTGFHADVRYEGTAQYPEVYNTYKGVVGNQNPSNQYGAPFQNNQNYQNNNGYGGSSSGFGATSNVNIKDFSGPGEPYNAGGNNFHGGNYGNGGVNYDSYTNNELTGNRAPNSHYGTP